MPTINDTIQNDDINRALSLIQLFGNAVFISESRKHGERLAVETLNRLNNGGVHHRAVRVNIKELINKTKKQAGPNLQNTIELLQEAPGKTGLIIADLEGAVEDSGIESALRDAIEKKSVFVLGLTNMAGFRKLEEKPQVSGLLQFILADREVHQAGRNKSVLIIGATSLLGNAVYQLFSREYGNVRGTGFNKAEIFGFDKLDVTSEEEIGKYFSGQPDFDIVVYVAGEANADIAEKEKDRTRTLNAKAVNHISRFAKNCKFVYISSEYVFDGNSAPYGSGSKANPINYYGRTKLEGEEISLKDFSNSLILRLGALYGCNGPADKETSVSKLIAALDGLEPIKADNVQIKHPLLLEDAARTLLKLLDYDASGVYQTNGPEGLNKQEMAERIAAVRKEVSGCAFSYSIVGVEQPGIAAKPLNTHMVNVDTPRPFNEGIRFLFQKQGAFKEEGTREYK